MNMDILSALKFGNTVVGARGAAAQDKGAAQNANKAASFRNELVAASRSRNDFSREKGDGSRVQDETNAARLESKQETPKKAKAPVKEAAEDQEKESKETKKNDSEALEELLSLLESLMNASGAEINTGEKQTEILEQLQKMIKELKVEGVKLPENVTESLNQIMATVERLMDMPETNGSGLKAAEADGNEEVKAFNEILGDAIKETKTLLENMKAQEHLQPINVFEGSENKTDSENIQHQTGEANGIQLVKPQEDKRENITGATEEAGKEAGGESVQTKTVQPEVKEVTDKLDTKTKTETSRVDENVKVENDEETAKKALEAKLEDNGKQSDENSEQQTAEQRDPKLNAVKTEAVTYKAVNAEEIAMTEDQIQLDKAKAAEAMQSNVTRASTVSKTDVINQIVKKAEFVMKDAQQELRMQLEPENLGKLTLKVAVERGLITAKFVAESQQVKEIIESNFNQLKDMLEEKGISVQNFSVSVGQDNKGQDQKNQFQMWKETIKVNGRNNSYGNFSVYEQEDQPHKVGNPYSYHDGKVDFKA